MIRSLNRSTIALFSLVTLKEEIFVGLCNGWLHRLLWNGHVMEDYSVSMSQIPFFYELESKPEYLTSATKEAGVGIGGGSACVHLSDLIYSPLIGGFGCVLSNGRAGFLTAQSPRYHPTVSKKSFLVLGAARNWMISGTQSHLGARITRRRVLCRQSQVSTVGIWTQKVRLPYIILMFTHSLSSSFLQFKHMRLQCGRNFQRLGASISGTIDHDRQSGHKHVVGQRPSFGMVPVWYHVGRQLGERWHSWIQRFRVSTLV